MNLMDILQGQLSEEMVGQLSEHIGAQPEQTAQAANGVFATLLGGLANNASSEGGLSALGAALDRDHDGSMLDDLAGMVGGMLMNGGAADNRATNGMGILGHILGDRQEVAAEQIGQSSGLSASQVMKLLPILAPIVMSVLGKAKNSGGLDLGSLAGVLLGGAQQAQQQQGMGDLLGNVLGSVLGGGQQQQQQQQSGAGDLLGSVLGGLFGKR
ncbi:MAG TPA: DUF937 domain-containing protein [Saprospiraceae bacterium]|nr:DUF937 domain-containing protein [Saprospiraceae bacterium]